MVFKPDKKFQHFADLKNTLAQSSKTDHALYTTIQEIIERLDKFRSDVKDKIDDTKKKLEDALKTFAPKTATYHTKDDELSVLPNSWQLLAGSGIIFNDSVPNKRTISSTGGSGLGNHYDCPLSDGDVNAADLIFANGECIIVQVPV